MQPKKILLATDFSESATVALDAALFWARTFEAELHLLHVLTLYGDTPAHDGPDLGPIYERLSAEAADKLRASTADLGLEGLILVEAQRRDVSAAPAILRYAEENGIEQIVIGSHGRRGWRRLLLGSVAEEVVRSADCPVLVVHGKSPRRERRVDRILVPFDFSPDSEESLEVAKSLAVRLRSHVDLVNVLPAPVTPAGQGMPVPGLPIDSRVSVDVQAQTMELLKKRALEASTPGVRIEPHLLVGHIPSRIVELAEELSADLILIGSHGATGMRRLLLGSVSERVVRAASCPVLVLRRPADEDEEEEENES